MSEADFSLGSLDLDESEADFSLGLDFSDYEEQIGGRHDYTIQLVRERIIQKFNVNGYDYKVHVDAFDGTLISQLPCKCFMAS